MPLPFALNESFKGKRQDETALIANIARISFPFEKWNESGRRAGEHDVVVIHDSMRFDDAHEPPLTSEYAQTMAIASVFSAVESKMRKRWA
jgi:hypothetical protein